MNREQEINLQAFAPITLEEMDRVRLMDRSDTKFIFHESRLDGFLRALITGYRVLEVGGHRRIGYESVYFDTDDLSLYHHHQCGRLNRFKIRNRHYVESAISFFEIKYKSNKLRTVKSRIREDRNMDRITGASDEFLQLHTSLTGDMLHAEVRISFSRITLVNKLVPERVTIDTNIAFRNGEQRNMRNLVIAEVKQERARRSEFVELMRHAHVHPGSLSKYCLAVATMHPGIRQNNFKPRLRRINKLTHDFAAGSINGTG